MDKKKPTFMNINDNKAGMKNLDKLKINEIILEASKGSKFYENEMKKEELLNKQLISLKQISDTTDKSEIEKGIKKADEILAEMKEEMDLTRSIVHIDMDAFYAAAEIKGDPSLRSKPMAVGSNSMLATSNYEARKYGVRAAMPGFIALKLCPELVIIEPDFEKYSRLSRDCRAVFSQYHSCFAAVGLDEAYLDLTEHLRSRMDFTSDQMSFSCGQVCRCKIAPDEVEEPTNLFRVCGKCGLLIGQKKRIFNDTLWSAVEELRFRVFAETGLTCSAGIGCNTLLSKIASDLRKPNGQYQISSCEEDIEEFMRDLPIRKVPGIGKVSERKLGALGVLTCADIVARRGPLMQLFKPISCRYFLRIALGDGETQLVERHQPMAEDEDVPEPREETSQKSLSVERTFADCGDSAQLLARCRSLCSQLAVDMLEAGVRARTVGIKLKLASFEQRTRAHTLADFSSAVADATQLSACACELLNTEIRVGPLILRLLGVRVSNLVPEEMVSRSHQWSLHYAFQQCRRLTPAVASRPHEPVNIEHDEVSLAEPEVQPESGSCPVCQKVQSLAVINQHLDECLNHQLLLPAQNGHPDNCSPAATYKRKMLSPRSGEKRQKLADIKLDGYFLKK